MKLVLRTLGALGVVLAGVAASAQSQPTEADYERAKATYTVEQLQADAFCGEASIVWMGEAAALKQRWIKDRSEFYDKKPDGTEALVYYRSQTDLTVAGMRVAGISDGGAVSGVSVAFEHAPSEVFPKLPGNPKMVKVAEHPAAGVTQWTEGKAMPRMVATSYKNKFTLVSCERGRPFAPKMK